MCGAENLKMFNGLIVYEYEWTYLESFQANVIFTKQNDLLYFTNNEQEGVYTSVFIMLSKIPD